jgi:hypothetical protein
LLLRFKITFIEFEDAPGLFETDLGTGSDDIMSGDVGVEKLRDAVGCLFLASADVGEGGRRCQGRGILAR